MIKLKRRFEPADLLPAPDLWDEARRRSTSPRPFPPGPPTSQAVRRRASSRDNEIDESDTGED